ncbi:hypothetical protein [Actinomadura sp. 7K534]|uniref:hypothetical protein n=1 Tax=Actinomadura sp. 7K534 TaxID=2530366 RepID=UPI00104F7479|nr:hypothetical protein [Actinomadura sp. 7K534]TDB96926.1 hypothetical protein E1266_08355 [Actinomadura sp. 7K534]
MNTLNAAATRAITAVINRLADLDSDRDRGSGVVETIIIVAGFAGLAFTVYLAVAGKVNGWINKIPGSTGP